MAILSRPSLPPAPPLLSLILNPIQSHNLGFLPRLQLAHTTTSSLSFSIYQSLTSPFSPQYRAVPTLPRAFSPKLPYGNKLASARSFLLMLTCSSLHNPDEFPFLLLLLAASPELGFPPTASTVASWFLSPRFHSTLGRPGYLEWRLAPAWTAVTSGAAGCTPGCGRVGETQLRV